jgi:hypothetical protein
LKKAPTEQVKLIDNYNNSYSTSLNVVVDLIGKAVKERVELVFAHFVPKQRVKSKIFSDFRHSETINIYFHGFEVASKCKAKRRLAAHCDRHLVQ